MTKRIAIKAFIGLGAAAVLSACGFQPIYATEKAGVTPLNQRVALREIAAPQDVAPVVEEAISARIQTDETVNPEYALFISVTESAQRLAVQIDATVTRYNYRLDGKYVLLDLADGSRINGSVGSVTSYNIVSSQYSTLYAENTAREKAARQLAEELERELLIRLSDNPDTKSIDPKVLDTETRIDAEIELLNDPRSGEVIEPPQLDQ